MFSSNQIFDVTCDLQDLPAVIRFGTKLSGCEKCMMRLDQRCRPAFQITEEGLYCFGIGSTPRNRLLGAEGKETPKGWTDYPCDYDPDIIGKIVAQWIAQQPAPASLGTNGTQEVGARVRCMETISLSGATHGIENGWTCILIFEPHMLTFDR